MEEFEPKYSHDDDDQYNCHNNKLQVEFHNL